MMSQMKSASSKQGYAKLLSAEAALIARRRETFEPHGTGPTIGLALSGGGIRSATFCLGVLQSLSKVGLTKHIDYLSTVSGGSYIGGFFGALFVPQSLRGPGTPRDEQRPDFDNTRPMQSGLGLEAVRRLRDSGRYLTPAGTSDAFYAGAIVIRNWTAVQTVIGLTVLMAFWFVRAVDNWWFESTPAISPSLALLSWLSLVFVFGFGSAYWLTRRDRIPKSRPKRIGTNLFLWAFAVAFCLILREYLQSAPSPLRYLELHFAAFMGVALVAYLVAELRYGKLESKSSASDSDDIQPLIMTEDIVRTKLSNWMATSLILFLTLAGLVLLDLMGGALQSQLVHLYLSPPPFDWSFGSIYLLMKEAWPIAVAAAPPMLSFIARQKLKREKAEEAAKAVGTKLSDPLPALLVIAGSSVVALWLILWSAVSHYPFEPESPLRGSVLVLGLILIAVNIIQSLCFSFINLSSLSHFYAARLRRAYLGASSYGRPFTNVRQDDPEDSIRVKDYYQGMIEHGGPLHIINVTIAETIAGTSNLVARDRKGKPMQLSPGGIVFEGDHPGTFEAASIEDGEELPLANWIAISGAAVSAAIGSGTSLGTSILATMANVRLGYWWRSRRAENNRDFLWRNFKDTVQNYLFLELRGAFDGTRRDRWYLTDGGHFENTGIYALLQRRVRVIIACDNGADPNYDMVDVVRLLQRARIDLGAEITFLSDEALAETLGPSSPLIGVIGTFKEVARNGDIQNPGGPIATLAKITYPDSDPGVLLLIKPRLTFTEPPELLAYRAMPGGRNFPQQTTGDQFFDEEQWEAYRRLGEFCGERLFAVPPPNHVGWYPYQLEPFDEKR
ncbi:hypothetical protein [Rhizobium sp. BR 314]|uniref:hypothetical protein n=1 Tax=Rhizobium sp. BR 314 TaxID=3040013 RepID=UPI0039BFB430